MPTIERMKPAHLLMQWAAAAILCAGVAARPVLADPQSAESLLAKYAELRPRLANNPFGKPLYLESSESQERVAGEVYAVVDHPFDSTAAALAEAKHWCEILVLPINTKYCRPTESGQASLLHVRIGRKDDQPDNAHRMDLSYRLAARTASYLQVQLNAEQGPIGTRDYRLSLSAVPVEKNRTFLHLSYSYSVGAKARLAMQLYLGTAGRDKVGFTVTGTKPGGQTIHIGGMRGIIERNAMRYYLAIEAFLATSSAPSQAQPEERLRNWFAAAERYPRQLHEMEQAEYLEMKRREYSRQRAGPLA
jgi:hypothetical protein